MATPIFNSFLTSPFGLTDVGASSAPTFADIDGDGDLDAFVGEEYGNTLFYRNSGSSSNPQFDDPLTNPFGLTDVGFLATPTFVDIDGDGDLDALVGERDAATKFYRNNGSSSNPQFDAPVTNPFGLTGVGFFVRPTFADIDGDGDLDAFVGNYGGNTGFYRNIGSSSDPQFDDPLFNPFGLTDVGVSSAPTFADIDGDGDLDAFVGEEYGNTLFYRNSGSSSNPQFETPVTNPFGLTDAGTFAKPTFADIDGDGDLDAFVGNLDGNILFFENAPAAAVTLTVAAGSDAAEPGTSGSFVLTLSQPAPDGGITIGYTLSGSALNGADYTIPATAAIAAGQTTVTVTVTPQDDALVEGTETITLTLADGSSYDLGATTEATISLTDNDQPSLSINDVTITEGNSGTTQATFTVALSQASGQAVSVSYATANSTATAGSDYSAISATTLTFAPGETTKTVSVSVLGDAVLEPDETFFVNLSGAVGATLADAQGVGTILNDDRNIINGTSKRDRLVGTANADRITGFQGNDKLTGGGGSDEFVYTNLRDAGDTITDFVTGTDKIVLTPLLQSLGLNLTYSTAVSQQYLSFVALGSKTRVLFDPDGAGTAARASKLLTVESVAPAELNNSSNFIL